jgi:CRP-like cAMP-binding protein
LRAAPLAEEDRLSEFLLRTPFFGGLDEAALELIRSMAVERTYTSGQMVFCEGELGRSMYVVLKGDLLVGRTGASGRLIKLMHVGPGDVLGETTLIEMRPRSTTVLVVQAACLYELTNANMYTLYQKNIHAYVMVLQNINRELCRRLRSEEGRICEVADTQNDEVTQITMNKEGVAKMGPVRR